METKNYCLGIKVESPPNAEVKIFHCRQKLLGYGKYANYVSEHSDTSSVIPVLTQAVINNLSEIVGIKKVSCWPYKIKIKKAVAYTWEELDEKIRKVFATYLPISILR